mmetsp:Transcript_5558/g.15774  ORF Transcript_5558/g.15774 Transcript_5558/m.15774 type:complete len:224 (+) Transcript_5558:775-1446(+)
MRDVRLELPQHRGGGAPVRDAANHVRVPRVLAPLRAEHVRRARAGERRDDAHELPGGAVPGRVRLAVRGEQAADAGRGRRGGAVHADGKGFVHGLHRLEGGGLVRVQGPGRGAARLLLEPPVQGPPAEPREDPVEVARQLLEPTCQSRRVARGREAAAQALRRQERVPAPALRAPEVLRQGGAPLRRGADVCDARRALGDLPPRVVLPRWPRRRRRHPARARR